jgi:Glutathione S-transferase, C-terminal domain
LLKLLSNHLEKNDFLMGDRVTVADFAFYGPFYAHLSRDPVPGYIIKTQAPSVAAWIDRISHVRLPTDGATSSDGKDEIPSTLLPILKLLMADFVPVVSATIEAVLLFLAQNPSKAIPRHLGSTTFVLHDGAQILVQGQRNINTHCVWMLQRILSKAYSDSRACDDALDLIAGKNSEIAQQWHAMVGKLQRSGWTISRNNKNQLVANRVSSRASI